MHTQTGKSTPRLQLAYATLVCAHAPGLCFTHGRIREVLRHRYVMYARLHGKESLVVPWPAVYGCCLAAGYSQVVLGPFDLISLLCRP